MGGKGRRQLQQLPWEREFSWERPVQMPNPNHFPRDSAFDSMDDYGLTLLQMASDGSSKNTRREKHESTKAQQEHSNQH
jgi:hypothetical protein